MIDCEDDSCLTQSGEFTSKEPDNCPELNNGQFVFSFNSEDIEVSIDAGMTYINDTVVNDLEPGRYVIFYRDINTLCEKESFFSPILLDASVICTETSPEECSDGIDNDNDGLIDCADDSCADQDVCALTESTTANCRDGLDNDEDGLTDCQDSDCRFFDFCLEPESDLIYLPNAFSLSGSGINSRLVPSIKDNQLVEIVSYHIFDRSGNRVFSRENVFSDDPSLSWDGRFNNSKVTSGVYLYVLNINQDGLLRSFTGDVTALK